MEIKSKNPPTQPQPAEKGNQEDLTFFNVMPKVKNSGLVSPTIKTVVTVPETKSVSEAQKAPGNPGDQGNLPNNLTDGELTSQLPKNKRSSKIYIFLALLIIILGTAAYFLVPRLLSNPYEEENYLAPGLGAKSQTELKNEWVIKYFIKADCDPNVCGDNADPDLDGLINLKEFQLTSDPNNKDSDTDGLADGDETNIFGSDPKNKNSGVNKQYSDADYIKGAYNLKTDQALTETEIQEITLKIKQFGIHQPTASTLEKELETIFKFSPDQASSTPSTIIQSASTTKQSLPEDLDLSAEGKQERDTQRSLTIKNIGIALIKYNTDNKSYPGGSDFKQMHEAIRVYLKIANNPTDPINVEPYIYTYLASQDKKDFTLTYYSETLNQVIKKTAKSALEDKQKEEASGYDDQRRMDLDSLRSALLIYSADNVAGNQEYVFPTKEKYQSSLVPKYLSSIPKDPKNTTAYDYQVSETFDTFTLKSVYDAPATGKTGYMCNQEDCSDY